MSCLRGGAGAILDSLTPVALITIWQSCVSQSQKSTVGYSFNFYRKEAKYDDTIELTKQYWAQLSHTYIDFFRILHFKGSINGGGWVGPDP